MINKTLAWLFRLGPKENTQRSCDEVFGFVIILWVKPWKAWSKKLEAGRDFLLMEILHGLGFGIGLVMGATWHHVIQRNTKNFIIIRATADNDKNSADDNYLNTFWCRMQIEAIWANKTSKAKENKNYIRYGDSGFCLLFASSSE